MSISVVILVIILAWIIYSQGGKAYRYYLFRQRVNKIPGPNFRIPFVGITGKMLTMPKEDRLKWFRDKSNEYKDGCFRNWFGTAAVVHIKKPEHVEVILRSTTEITKSTTYDYLKPWLGEGLLTSTGSQWHRRRKLITPAFHFKILDEFTEVMFDKAEHLTKCIARENKINGDKPIDMFALCTRFTLDVICETAMGVAVDAQDNIESNYTNAVHTITTAAVNRFFRPWLKYDWIFYNTASGKEFQAAINAADDLCTRVIIKKQQMKDKKTGTCPGMSKKKAFLDLLLEANETDDDPMSIEELRHQTNTFIFAGHDTTAALLAWAFFCLGIDLDVQKKVHDELDEVLGDSDYEATLERLPNLKYLDRVIKEVLRLYPSATAVSRILGEDLQIGEHTVPRGAIVGIMIYQLHTDSSTWKDPLRFDPDRFLPENMKGRHPYAYVPFSAGPRNCIGQKFAKLESKLALVQVLRKYTVKSVENHETIKKYSNVILRPVDGIYVYMTKRSAIENNTSDTS